MKLDMHVHTRYSYDSILSLDKLRRICNKTDITPIIADHNNIEGAVKFKARIIAEEIKTLDGDLIGLFLNEKVKPNLTIEETIDEIKRQYGLVYIPHPFDARVCSLKEIIKGIKFDIIEVFNSRSFLRDANKMALDFANNNGFLKGVGSDAHISFEVGRSYVIIDDFDDKKEFLINLKKAEFICNKSPLWVHIPANLIGFRKFFYNRGNL